MPRVELITIPECPNADGARRVLAEALGEAGLPIVWTELRGDSADLPPHARGFGSPTILIDGRDPFGLRPGRDVTACRVYPGGGGRGRGVPPLAELRTALLQHEGAIRRSL